MGVNLNLFGASKTDENTGDSERALKETEQPNPIGYLKNQQGVSSTITVAAYQKATLVNKRNILE